jgi:hypothetical protein
MEQDTRLVTLSGILLMNRLLWLGFSGLMLILGLHFTQKPWSVKTRAKEEAPPITPAHARTHQPIPLDLSPWNTLRLLGRQLLFESKAAFKNIYFISLALGGFVLILTTAQHMSEVFGTTTWPVTYDILESTVTTFILFLNAILIFYSGELLWRERQSHMHQILDALPQPAWLPLLGKFLALQLIILSLLALCGLTSMGIQLAHGYTKFEIDQVAKTLLLITYPRYLILSSFFFAIHVLVDNKYLGHTVCAAFLLAHLILPLLDFSQALYLPGSVAGSIDYSDMNGYGPFMPRLRALQLYWGLGGLLTLIAAYLFWPYGTDSALSLRRRLARQRFTRPLVGLTSLVVLAFAAQGSYIYYNTHVLTEYRTKAQSQESKADYEKTYKAEWEKREQLQYVATHVKADIFPEEQALKSEVLFTLQNKSQEPIQEIFLHVPLDADQFTLEFDHPAELVHSNERKRLRMYRFLESVAPQAELRMTYRTDYRPRGFVEMARETELVENGSFFNNGTFFPTIGYNPDLEIELDKEREKKAFGREEVEKYLRHQGKGYLRSRSSEAKREWPLALNENQGYLHYNKGAVVMYALKDTVGEDSLNAAIRRFTDSVRYQEPPFTTSLAFVESLNSDLGPQHAALIDELFQQVTLYDNRIQSHQLTENPDGSVTVDLEILGRKIDVDEKGAQKDVDFALNIEIGGHDPADKLLPGSRHLIKTGVNKVQLKFAQKPKSIWLDPMHTWIDLNHEDNRVKL